MVDSKSVNLRRVFEIVEFLSTTLLNTHNVEITPTRENLSNTFTSVTHIMRAVTLSGSCEIVVDPRGAIIGTETVVQTS